MAQTNLLFDVIALLLAAVVIIPLLQRLGVPSILGYLAAGVALGPYTPGPVVDAENTRPLAEFGVVFLLFAIGLELSLSRLRLMRRYIFGYGLLQVALTSLVLGGLGWLVGLSPGGAVIVGLTLSFSSTAAVLSMMVERNETVTHHGRVAVSVLIFQDLAVVPVLALLPLLTRPHEAILPALGLAAIKAIAAIVGIYGVGRYLVRPFYRYIAATRNSEVFTATNLLLVLAVAWLTEQAGMSMALGAFLAGLLLADSSYRHQIEADIEPFRGLLLGLFFMLVGMSLNLPLVAAQWPQILILTLGTMAVKAIIMAGLAWGVGLGWAVGVRVGLLLAQVGEFAFVVFERAGHLSILPPQDCQMFLAVIALSMVLTPVTAVIGRRLAVRSQRQAGEQFHATDQETERAHVVIAGYGRVGQAIARMVNDHGLSYVALDLDADRVIRARKAGLPVFYGDAGQAGVLRSVGILNAAAAVVTVNHPRSAEKAVAAMRSLCPELDIVVRTQDVGQEKLFHRAGANALVPETMEASLQMAGLVLRSAGVAAQDVERTLQHHRNRYRGTLGHAGLSDFLPK